MVNVSSKDVIAPNVELACARLEAAIAVKLQMLQGPFAEQVVDVARQMAACLRAGGKIIFFGNGGSAQDAGHLAAELMGRFRFDRPGLAAISLPDATSSMTAIGNDYSFDDVFARQVTGIGRPGDLAFGLTTSGNSTNVVRALEAAISIGMIAVVLTGASGGKAAAIADIAICVPTDDTARAQEAALHLGHTICEVGRSGLVRSTDLTMLSPGSHGISAVFLDRDGTLNAKPDRERYVTTPEGLTLLPGAAEAVASLNAAGVRTILVTNQRWLSVKMEHAEIYSAIHERLVKLLAERGAWLDAAYCCPHPVSACDCRKPAPGMLLRAAAEHGLDLDSSVIVGDSDSDVAPAVQRARRASLSPHLEERQRRRPTRL